MNFILIAVIVLGGIALISAVILYVCSKKFAVHEDPRLGQVTAVLPEQIAEDVAILDVQVWPVLW